MSNKKNSSTRSKQNDSTWHIFLFLGVLYFLTFITYAVFACTYSKKEAWLIWSTLLMVAGAASVCGFLPGFLFGIPRSVRFAYRKNDDASKDDQTSFAENTNLEEISDWLTKIVVGISLTQYEYIKGQLYYAVTLVAGTLDKTDRPTNGLLAVGYAILIFNFGLGFFGAYYWTRTRFGSILAQNRKNLEEFFVVANSNLSNLKENVGTLQEVGLETTGLSITDLATKVEGLLKEHPVIHKDDTQKDRWNGMAISKNRVLRASVVSTIIPKLFNVTIEVASTSPDIPLKSPVVVLLDETFPESEVYLNPENNVARIKVIAYEAFTVAALCDDTETQLELDLQKVKGFPFEFYYK